VTTWTETFQSCYALGCIFGSGVSRVWQSWHVPWVPLWWGHKNCLAKIKIFVYSFLNHYSAAHATARDLMRLDGTQDNKQVWGPHVRTWGLSEANALYWKKYLWHCWAFSTPHTVSRLAHGDSAAGELCPSCPPSLCPFPIHS